MSKTQKKVQIKASEPEEALPKITPTIIPDPSQRDAVQFRIYVGSYEHNLLCVSLNLPNDRTKTPVFQPIFHFQAHALSIKSISAAKRYLVTGANDEHIRIYDLQKRKELGNLMGHQGSISTLRFSSEHNAEGAEISKAGKWLLSGSEDGKIIVWRTKDWEIFGTLKGHDGKVNDIAIHPSGRIAVSVGVDKSIRLWNLMTAKKAANLKIKNEWQAGEFVRWCQDGTLFYVGLLNKVLLYKISEAKEFRELGFAGKTLMHIEPVVIGDVEYLACGLGNGAIEFYDLKKELLVKEEDFKPEFTLHGHTNRIKDFKLYKNSNGLLLLISISSDGNIIVWDLALRDQIAVYNTGERLNCVEVTDESVEKMETVKKRVAEEMDGDVSESENEDTEELKKIMEDRENRRKKGKRGGKKRKGTEKISVDLE